jgi:hypothetical protein
MHYKLYKQCGTLVDKIIFYRGFGRGATVGTCLRRVHHVIENERLRLPGQVFWRWSDVDHLGRYSEGENVSLLDIPFELFIKHG